MFMLKKEFFAYTCRTEKGKNGKHEVFQLIVRVRNAIQSVETAHVFLLQVIQSKNQYFFLNFIASSNFKKLSFPSPVYYD
jgi:hypothetical protein